MSDTSDSFTNSNSEKEGNKFTLFLLSYVKTVTTVTLGTKKEFRE